jgi:hypothetical protein
MRDEEQGENLERVNQRIGESVLEFHDSWGYDRPFHADDLRNFVIGHAQVAPASADRILRDLRQRGLLDYKIVNRRQSLYQFVRPDAELAPEPKPKRKPRPPAAQMDLFS